MCWLSEVGGGMIPAKKTQVTTDDCCSECVLVGWAKHTCHLFPINFSRALATLLGAAGKTARHLRTTCPLIVFSSLSTVSFCRHIWFTGRVALIVCYISVGVYAFLHACVGLRVQQKPAIAQITLTVLIAAEGRFLFKSPLLITNIHLVCISSLSAVWLLI